MLLSALKIPPVTASMILDKFQGALPATEQQYITMIAHLRRNTHLADHRTPNDHNIYAPAQPLF
eukprot:1209376-Heterocapsa_arctica.AAC.1